jgi:hypothetical protein
MWVHRRLAPVLFVKAIALGQGRALAADEPTGKAPASISDEAKRHFRAGVNFLHDPHEPQFEEAYNAFRLAYAATPSPKILGNLGFCAMKLERDGEAIEAYEAYLAQVDDITADERKQVKRDLDALRSAVVPLTLHVSPAHAVVVDTRVPIRRARVANAYAAQHGVVRAGIRPGRHDIRVLAPGYEPYEFSVEAQSGQPIERRVTLAPKQTARTDASLSTSPGRVAPWLLTGGGVGLAAAGAAATFGAFGADGEGAGKVLLVGGGLLTAAGITWLVAAGGSSRADATPGTLPPTNRAARASAADGPRAASPVQAGGVCSARGCFGTVGVMF